VFAPSDSINYTGSSNTASLTITKENAVVTPSAANPSSVPGTVGGTNTAAFTISATFQDMSDGSRGNINLAQPPPFVITLSSITSINSIPCSPTVTTVDAYTLQASCTFAPYTVPVDVYDITYAVNSADLYYTGSTDDVLSVTDPSVSATGGGWFRWPVDKDGNPTANGDKTNFGFVMSFGKKGTNAQGSALVIRHRPDGSIVRMKSNTITAGSVGTGANYGWGVMTGKATYDDTADAIDQVGGIGFTVYAEDWNQPGTLQDKFWVQVNNPTGPGYLTLPSPSSTNAIPINGGNTTIPHTSGKP
jgi:hypothetical protein